MRLIIEIHEDLDIEVLQTLRSIRLADQVLARHVNAESQDLIIDQYKFLKKDLCGQLAELISKAVNTKVQIAV